MTRLFLTLYIGISALLVGLFFTTQYLVDYWFKDDLQRIVAEQARGVPTLLESLAAKRPMPEVAEEMTAAFDKSMLPLSVTPFPKDHAPLPAGEIQVLDAENFLLHYRTKDSKWLMTLGPNRNPPDFEYVNYLFLTGLFISLAGVCLAWITMLKRKIRRLEETTLAFATGDLDARAPVTGAWRLGSLNDNFNTMATRIQRLVQSHKQLTNAVAHELRSPIFRLRFRLDVLAGAANPETRVRALAGTGEDLDELDDLVDELLTHARLERINTELALHETDLVPWLAEQHRRLTTTTHVNIGWYAQSSRCPVRLDEKLLARALDNLVRNALTHGRQRVTLELELADGYCLLHVDDDGPGVPAADRERIFDPFVRLDDSRTRSTGGHGLGLSIVREAVRLHQGQISVADSPLGGARFTVRLPLASATDIVREKRKRA